MGKIKEELSRRRSVNSVGELYPVLLAKDGKIIDGHHRLEDNPGWRTETLEHIDSEEKILLARAASNWHRRTVSKEEKTAWITGLAQIYIDQGFKVYGKNPSPRGGPPINEVMNKIIENLGVCRQTVTTYLDDKYKQTGKGGGQGGPRVPAIQAIETLARNKPRLADDVVKRYEKEVREKLLYDKGFRREMLLQIEEEALAKEDKDEDPEIEALTTQSLNNLVFQYQDGLRQLSDNPILNPFSPTNRATLRKWGVIERVYKVFRVYVLTSEAQKALLNIKE